MNNSNWVRVTKCENIPPREGRAVLLDGREVAVFNLGGRFLALENSCPHRGGPLADGILNGDKVVCPLHARKVCLKSGAMEKAEAHEPCVQTYSVRVLDGYVELLVPEWQPLSVPLSANVFPIVETA